MTKDIEYGRLVVLLEVAHTGKDIPEGRHYAWTVMSDSYVLEVPGLFDDRGRLKALLDYSTGLEMGEFSISRNEYRFHPRTHALGVAVAIAKKHELDVVQMSKRKGKKVPKIAGGNCKWRYEFILKKTG
jgi:hypothetical protein